MSQNEEVFTAAERRELAVKAVNRLIADAEESASKHGLTTAAPIALLRLRKGRAILARLEPEYEYDLDVDRHNELLPLP